MRSLAVAAVALVALLLLPGTQAGTLYEVEGKWYARSTGTVGVSGLPGIDARARIFVDHGAFYYRVIFDPVERVFLECLNGKGFFFANGATLPAAHCSLELNGAYAIPRATMAHADGGQLPGQFGRYLGPLWFAAGGSGSFRVA